MGEGRGCPEGNWVVRGQEHKGKKSIFCFAGGLVARFAFAQVQATQIPASCSMLPSVHVPVFIAPSLSILISSLSVNVNGRIKVGTLRI